MTESLASIGWGPHWAALLAQHGEAVEAARVVRHDGVAVQVRADDGERTVKLRRGVDAVTVGDWLAVDGEQVVALLDRSSLLRRRAAGGDDHQLLAANIDLVLLVCGLDRRIVAGRVQRGVALARDAGAHPLLVLTKADLHSSSTEVARTTAEQHPGLEVIVTSSTLGTGIDELRTRLTGATSVLLGESGAGKSHLVNALLDAEAALVGAVRAGDSKGRHTTTNRQMHNLPGGGVIIDSPGIREVGLAGDEGSVAATFADIDEVAEECRFSDCSHVRDPGCAIALAVAAGDITQARVDAYLELRAEAAAASRVDGLGKRQGRRRPSTPAPGADSELSDPR